MFLKQNKNTKENKSRKEQKKTERNKQKIRKQKRNFSSMQFKMETCFMQNVKVSSNRYRNEFFDRTQKEERIHLLDGFGSSSPYLWLYGDLGLVKLQLRGLFAAIQLALTRMKSGRKSIIDSHWGEESFPRLNHSLPSLD